MPQKTLNRRRKSHAPRREPDEDDIVFADSIYLRFLRRQKARLVFSFDLPDCCLVIGRVRLLKLYRSQIAADLLADEFRYNLRIVRAG